MSEDQGDATWRRATIALIVGLCLLRLVYLGWGCPYNLIEDEAQYWEWSRRLDWSYYSKGPGIAWVIAASTRLLGANEFGVRAPAPIFGLVAALALVGLTRDLTRAWRPAFFVAAAFNLVPLFQATSGLVLTIDMPYAACWSIAAWAGWRALTRDSVGAWVTLGLALAAGFLFKYTMLLLVPGLIIFAWWHRRVTTVEAPRQVRAIHVAIGGVLAALGLLPVVLWNAQHDWATLRHLLGHLHAAGGDVRVNSAQPERYEVRWTLEFIATQFGLVGPALGLAAWEVLRARRDRVCGAEGSAAWIARGYLTLIALPILVFYVAVTFRAEAEANWALAGYATVVVLAGLGAARGMAEWRQAVAAWRALPRAQRPRAGWLTRRPESFPQVVWHFTLVYGTIGGLIMLRGDWLAFLPGVGSLVPLGRLTGGPAMAAHVDELRAELRRRTGREPFVVAEHYGRASQLGFYLSDRPMVYVASSKLGGRKTQWDLWPDMSLDDLAVLGGRPAVLIGGAGSDWSGAFAEIEPVGTLRGDRKRGRPAFVGLAYRGFPQGIAPPAPGQGAQ